MTAPSIGPEAIGAEAPITTSADACVGVNCFSNPEAILSIGEVTDMLGEKGIEVSEVTCRGRCEQIGHCATSGITAVANLDLSGGRGGYDREPGFIGVTPDREIFVGLPRKYKKVKIGTKVLDL